MLQLESTQVGRWREGGWVCSGVFFRLLQKQPKEGPAQGDEAADKECLSGMKLREMQGCGICTAQLETQTRVLI